MSDNELYECVCVNMFARKFVVVVVDDGKKMKNYNGEEHEQQQHNTKQNTDLNRIPILCLSHISFIKIHSMIPREKNAHKQIISNNNSLGIPPIRLQNI